MPRMLIVITMIVDAKIVLVLFCATPLRKEVILDFFSFWKNEFFVEKIFKIDGSKVKVIIRETKRPNAIIHPKSIIGLIPLNIRDKKAQIVVRTVYKIGKNILLEVQSITSLFEIFGFSFFNCKNLTVIWMFIAMFRISIKAIKFEDITVTFQPNKPSNPIIIKTEKKQLKSGIATNKKFLKTNHNVKTIKRNTPPPKTIMSFLT